MATEPPITSGGGGMVARIVALLTHPKDEWTRIAAEPMTTAGIMTRWVVPLALIRPVAELIGSLSTGVSIQGIPIAPPTGFLAATFAMDWALAVLGIYVLARVIDALAPGFGGQRDAVAALKVAAFGSVAGFLAGICLIHPMLSLLGLAGLYTFYIIHEGLPVLMKSEHDRTLVYMVAVFLVAIVLLVVAGWLTRTVAYSLLPPGPFGFEKDIAKRMAWWAELREKAANENKQEDGDA